MNESQIEARIVELFPKEANRILEIFDKKKLNLFYKFLNEYNEVGGFFSKADSEFILDRHLIESIYHVFVIWKEGFLKANLKLADVGSGPGLPGYIFFCLNEAPQVTLIDSQKRRLGILEKFHRENFKDSNVHFIYERVESIQNKFDLVTMRSTIKYPWSVEMTEKLLKMNSIFIPFLGKKVYDLEFEKNMLENLGIVLEKDIELDELEFLGKRHLKILKKVSNAKKNFPRSWEVISKEIKRTSWEK